MGNCFSCLDSGREDVDDIKKLDLVKDQLKAINDASKIDKLLDIFQDILQRKALAKSGEDKPESSSQKDLCDQFINSGATFLGFLNDHIEKSSSKGNFVSSAPEIIGKVLERLGNVHWVVGGLSVISYLENKMSENDDKCIETLQQMVDLTEHVKKLNYRLQREEEKLKKATLLIVEGCVICASQSHSQPFFRFLKTSVDAEALDSLQKDIHVLYSGFILTHTVGLARPQEEVIGLLELKSIYTPSIAVVIYGFGEIGKTTLAEAVVAAIDLENYNYSRVDFNEDFSKKHITSMQEKILNQAFPNYAKGIQTKSESCCTSEGRTVLKQAFKRKGNKPVFLFIDNALRKEDLCELFSGDLRGLPQGSRILVTTRDLGATDMLTEYQGGLRRRAHLVDPLPREEAKDVLLQGCANRHFDDIKEDVEIFLKICKGVPLVLKIVRGHFRKQGYSAEKCRQIIEALETVKDVKHESLSKHVTDFVYDQFEESTQQALLDICYFFSDWNPDQVECIVGAQELISLEEASFVQRSSQKELIVHDIIRERARNKSKSTRIMDMESLTHAVANEQELEHIRGVRLVNKGESEYVLEIQHLKAMRKLRVLALEGCMRVNGRSHLTFKELRFLRVRGDIPSLSLNLKGLPKLAFYEGPLFKEGISMYTSPKELEVIKAGSQSDIKNCPVLEISFSEEEDSKLKMLILKGWDQMVELSEKMSVDCVC